jgi:uncharacterized protein
LLALAAQGLATPASGRRPGPADLRRVARQLQIIQIDAVNVLVRSHYPPHFARLGPYDTDALDRMAYRDKELFEYPGHAASLMTVDHHPLMRWRMEEHRVRNWEPTLAVIEKKRPG